MYQSTSYKKQLLGLWERHKNPANLSSVPLVTLLFHSLQQFNKPECLPKLVHTIIHYSKSVLARCHESRCEQLRYQYLSCQQLGHQYPICIVLYLSTKLTKKYYEYKYHIKLLVTVAKNCLLSLVASLLIWYSLDYTSQALTVIEALIEGKYQANLEFQSFTVQQGLPCNVSS